MGKFKIGVKFEYEFEVDADTKEQAIHKVISNQYELDGLEESNVMYVKEIENGEA
jgi:hypothetical protein